MPNRTYSAVITLPPVKETCFVITPFKSGLFDEIFNAITRAAGNVRLVTHRTKDDPVLSFPQDIDTMLKEAQVAVAVCIPEPDSTHPNPNVMYELGKAHALGKPVLIIASSEVDLPANIRDKYYVQLIPGDLQSLVTNLENRLRATRERTKGKPVDPAWEPTVTMIEPRYQMCVRPEFFVNFTAVIDFGERVSQNFQPIGSQLSQLESNIADILRSFQKPDQKKIDEFHTIWSNYTGCYRNTNNQIFSNPGTTLTARLQSVQSAFDSLRQLACNDRNLEGSFDDANIVYGYIKDDLPEYPGLHDEIQRDLSRAFKDRRETTSLSAKIISLSRLAKSLVSNSYTMVLGTLDVFVDEAK